MKSLFVVVVLAVLSASNEAAVAQNDAVHIQNEAVDVQSGVVEVQSEEAEIQTGVASRSNLNHGHVSAWDTLLHMNFYIVGGLTNTIQFQEITYQGSIFTRITAIRATEVGQTQWAVPSVMSGGVGSSFATIRLTTIRGHGFHYLVEIWGRV